MKKAASIFVSIQSPERTVWEGECASLSSSNSDGTFDLMPDHARFLTVLHGEEILLDVIGADTQTFTFPHAVLFFQDNMAKIYVHTAS